MIIKLALKKAQNTPKAIDDYHELVRGIIPQLEKFPRNHCFTFGDRIEMGLLDVLSELVSYSRDKAEDLDFANRPDRPRRQKRSAMVFSHCTMA